MKRLSFLIVVICILTTCKKEDIIPSQLLKNSDLESGDLSVWYNCGSALSGFNLTSEESYSQTHSLILDCEIADNPDSYCWSQSYTGKMPYGEDLTLSAKIKGVNLTGPGVCIRITASNPEISGVFALQTTQSDPLTSITGTFDWTEYSIRLPNLHSSVSTLNISLYYLPKTAGKVYFDDIKLTHK